MAILTLNFRIKDKTTSKKLAFLSKSVNFVWNYCNEVQILAINRGQKWHTAFDFNKLTSGCGKELGLHSQTVEAVCEKYFLSRKNSHKRKLRWRSKKSLGWIPFRANLVNSLYYEVYL